MRSIIVEDWRQRVHLALVDNPDDEASGDVDPVEAVAEAKIARARCLDDALKRLRPDEQAVSFARPMLFSRLCTLPLAYPPPETLPRLEVIEMVRRTA